MNATNLLHDPLLQVCWMNQLAIMQYCLKLQFLGVSTFVLNLVPKRIAFWYKFSFYSFLDLRESYESRFLQDSDRVEYFESLMWIFENLTWILSNFGLKMSKPIFMNTFVILQ